MFVIKILTIVYLILLFWVMETNDESISCPEAKCSCHNEMSRLLYHRCVCCIEGWMWKCSICFFIQ